MKRNLLIFGVLMIGIWMYGCGENDDTTLAKIEEARIAMDNRDFDKAVSILGPLLDKNGDGKFDGADVALLTSQDSELALDLASAYLGRAGVDVIAFLNAAAEANPQAKTQFKKGVRFALSAINIGAQFFVVPAFAQTSGVDCLNDKNFKVISNALPTLNPTNLSDLELGIEILDKIKSFVTTNIESLQKNTELLRAVGHFTRIVMDLILATDSSVPRNNIPDKVTINTSTVTAELVSRVDDSFTQALAAISQSGILGTVGGTNFNENDFSKSIVDLRNTIRDKVPDGTAITADDLISYLNGLVSQCALT